MTQVETGSNASTTDAPSPASEGTVSTSGADATTAGVPIVIGMEPG